MASAHGRDTVITLTGSDLSYATKQATWERNPDIHDITGFGKVNKVKRGGLGDGTSTLSGWYDTTAMTSPRAVIEPIVGTVVTYIHKPEGTGTGKPQRSVSVVVGKYVETAAVDDIVTWTLDLAHSDTVTLTTQS